MLTISQVPTQDDPRLPRHRSHYRINRSGRTPSAELHRHSFLRKIHQLDDMVLSAYGVVHLLRAYTSRGGTDLMQQGSESRIQLGSKIAMY
jgi:hypothetical protein